MITITKNEEVVLDQIKIFNMEYPDGIPVNWVFTNMIWYKSWKSLMIRI